MFNLVKYRYLFLFISLLVIIPGTLSLIVKGLDVGIDFRGGSDVELRPRSTVSVAQVEKSLKPLNLADLTVVTGDVGSNPSIAGNKIVWVRLNTQVDQNVQNVIFNSFNHTGIVTQKYPEAKTVIRDIPGTKPYTLITITNFATAPRKSDIQALFSNLPKTSDPSKGAPTATATPTTTATPAATTTATAKSTATPAATPTTNNPANIPVSVADIAQGSSTQTFTIQTTTRVQQTDLSKLYAALLNDGGPYVALNSISEVGPSVASDTTRNSILAVLAASVLILLYISFSFRKVAKPWRYGACAIIALLHDVLVVLGIFSILGWLFHIQVDALFITALLTVVGFSVHDTIVVFDRIRENMQRRTSETFEQVVNASLVQTLARSLNTSLTVIFTLTALTLFGGTGSVHNFTLALLIGIVSGTYSSIFNASMLLVMWEKGELGFGRSRRDEGPSVSRREERELARARG